MAENRTGERGETVLRAEVTSFRVIKFISMARTSDPHDVDLSEGTVKEAGGGGG